MVTDVTDLDPDQHRASDTASVDFAQLAQRHRPTLLRYFRRHLESDEDAEDLAQEALVRLLRSDAIGGIANVEAFLLRIATNLLRDRFRHDSSHHAGMHLSFEETLHEWPSEEPAHECVYHDRERLKGFLSALDELSPRCRQIFLLQRFEGLTYSAIAKQLGLSVSAVEKHMMRALLHFDARLKES